jgi:threonine 3-dehydrogenase
MSGTYLITGGAGNLACQLTFDLARRADRIVLMDVADRPATAIAPDCEYVRGDVTSAVDLGAVIEKHRPLTILHFASLLSGSCEADRDRAWRVNMDGAYLLFELCLKHGVRQVLFPSSVATYGGTLPNPLPEDFPQWPMSLYGVTKIAVERLGCYYQQRHGLDFRALRLPFVLSAYAPAGATSAYASRAFVEAVRNDRFTFKVRPQTRSSLMYVKDVLGGMIALLAAPAERLTRRVYNVHAISPSAQDLADAIRRRVPGAQLDFEPDPQLVELIEGWPYQIEDASARRDWGWNPTYELGAMADDFVRELREG